LGVYQTLLKQPITDIPTFISVLDSTENDPAITSGFTIPAIVKVAINQIIRTFDLMQRMALQAA